MNTDFTREAVPDNGKVPLLTLIVIFVAFVICASSLFIGAELSKIVHPKDIVAVTIYGNAILFIIMFLTCNIGCKLGLSSALIAKRFFGIIGGKVISVIFAVALLGWFAVQTGFFGQTLEAMFPDYFLSSKHVAMVWGGSLMILTASFGIKGLDFISKIATPAILLISIYTLATLNPNSPVLTTETNFTDSISAVIGGWIVGAIILSDYTRFAKNNFHSIIAIFIGIIVSNTIVILAGYYLSVYTEYSNLPLAMLSSGMGFLPLVFIVLSQWTTNDSNLYSSSLSLASFIDLSKGKIVLVLGAIGIIVALLGLSDHFIDFLIFLGIVFPPIGSIFIIDYYILKSECKKAINYFAFIAILLGIILSKTITLSIPVIDAMVFTAVIYSAIIIFSKIKNVGNIKWLFTRIYE